MPTTLSSQPLVPISKALLTNINNLQNASDDATRGFSKGPADLLAIEIDNTQNAASVKVWVKLFDDSTSAWTPGTTAPILLVPCPAYDAAAPLGGWLNVYCLEGFKFVDGMSASASGDDGDSSATAPTGAGPNVNVVHRPPLNVLSSSAPIAALLNGLRKVAVGGAVENTRALIGGSNATFVVVSSSSETVYRVRINATQNGNEDVYVRFFNTTTPTVGTTDAEFMLPCRKGKDVTWEIPRGITLATALSVATVKNAGATSGNTSPTGTVDVIVDYA